jgi:cephalosporin hydroxylase
MPGSDSKAAPAGDPDFAVASRPFHGAMDGAFLSQLQRGVMNTRYRGVRCLKSPFDLVLYLQLIHRLRPRTIIEIGSKCGGSALWFADTLSAHGITGRIVSVDLEPPGEPTDSRIEFLKGDALALAECLPASRLQALPRPWLVVEDSAHVFDTTLATLEFFERSLAAGDYVVIEDGVVDQLAGAHYRAYANGPNRAVVEFLAKRPDQYAIDTDLCDHFGYNVTYCPNAWLRRL